MVLGCLVATRQPKNDFLKKGNLKYTPLSQRSFKDLLIVFLYFTISVYCVVFYNLFTKSHTKRNSTSNKYITLCILRVFAMQCIA